MVVIENMKFSVIIPVYNVELYLEDCIESVLKQTYQNVEIILVDDGSQDGSGVICDRYAERYPEEIKVAHIDNQGVLHARLYGLKMAIGDVVLFVDSDDRLRHDALKLMNEQFCLCSCDLLIFNASTHSDFSVPYLAYPWENKCCFDEDQKTEIYRFLIKSSKFNSLCLKAAKRNLAESIHSCIKFKEIKNGEDLLCTLPLVTNAQKISVLDECLYYYRVRENSATHSVNLNRRNYLKVIHEELDKYIALWGLHECIEIHQARKVRGWVDFIKEIFIVSAVTAEERKEIFFEMANDTYFRSAYIAMDICSLSTKQRLLAKLLYEKNYNCMELLMSIIRIKNKLNRK